MTSSTVSIQKTATICTAWAFGALAAAWPSKNAMLSVPPPKKPSGGGGAVEMMMVVVLVIFCLLMASRSNLLGSSNRACVMVSAAIKRLRSCGILGVFGFVAVWLANRILLIGLLPVTNGVMSTAAMFGGPGLPIAYSIRSGLQ